MWSEDVAEQMWYQVLEWRRLGWLTDEEADKIRDVIVASIFNSQVAQRRRGTTNENT